MKSIQTKLIVFIASLICFTAAIITASSLWLFYTNMVGQLEEEVDALGHAYNETIRNHMSSFKSELEIAASVPDITQVGAKRRDALLEQLASKTGFSYLALSDVKGQTSRNSDISERVYFQQALEGQTYTSSPLVNQVDHSVTIMMATPIDNGTPDKGVLYGGIPYDTFSHGISNIKIGEGGYAFVVDSSGVLVAHPNASLVEEMVNYIELAKTDASAAPVAEVVTRMISGESATVSSVYNGERWMYVFKPLEGPEGWSVAVSVPLDQIMGKTYAAIFTCVMISLLLAAAGIVLAVVFARSLTRPLLSITQRIELLAEGNLTDPVPFIKGRDELARLTAALNRTITELHSYIGDISDTLSAMADNDFTTTSNALYKGEFMPIRKALDNISDSLNHALSVIVDATEQADNSASQISMGAQSLAASSSEQAASVAELTAGISKISEQDAKNLEVLYQTAQIIEQANAGAQDSAREMTQLNTAMTQISSSSEQINKITRLIDDIAFQTNILALNAAIEAARAGNAGKGFAVVAGEVRSLAAKSADAAKRTAELIRGSEAAVSEGMAVAEKTARILGDVARQANEAAESINGIRAASDEQALAIEQISQGVVQVSFAVQANAATAQQSSASSEELSAIAAQLKREVGRFRIVKEGETGPDSEEAPARGASNAMQAFSHA